MLKAQIHIHTNYIQDDEAPYSPKELIDLAKEKGFDVLAFSEHELHYPHKSTLSTYYDFKNYAEENNILLIPAVELTIEGKHVLALNFLGDSKEYKTFEDLKQLKNKHPNTLLVAAHPYFLKPICLGKELENNLNLFDAIEYSYYYTRIINRNKKAVEIAKKYNKPLIATSDVHRRFQLEKTYSLINAEKNIPSILKAIKENKIKIVTKPLSNTFLFTFSIWVFINDGIRYIKRKLLKIY